MLTEYIVELIGEVPQSLTVIVYFFSFLLVLFGLVSILHMLSVIFRKFF